PALLRIAEKNKSIVAKVQDFKEPGAGVLLTSVDGKATLVVLDLATEYTEQRNWPVLDEIEQTLRRLQSDATLPSDLRLDLTGSATVDRDVNVAQAESASSTELSTSILVILLLFFLSRAPLLA